MYIMNSWYYHIHILLTANCDSQSSEKLYPDKADCLYGLIFIYLSQRGRIGWLLYYSAAVNANLLS